MKRIPWFEILIAIAVIAVNLYAALSDSYNLPNAWFTRDDAYYYFKVAQNISEGHGSTFDGLSSTNGYHPLWLLVCIPVFALARFDLILPLRLLLLLLGMLSLGTALLLYRILSRAVSRIAGMLVAIYWVFDIYIQGTYYKQGLESGIALFFIVLLIYGTQRLVENDQRVPLKLREIALLGLLAALTVLSRLDLIFFAGVMGLWIVFRGTPVRYFLPLDLLAVFTAVVMAFLERLGFPKFYEFSDAALTMAVISILIKIPVFYFLGLYQRPAAWSPIRMVRDIFLATASSSLLLAAGMLAGNALGLLPSFPRLALLTDAGLTLFMLILTRCGAFYLQREYKQASPYRRVLRLKEKWKSWLIEAGVYYGVISVILVAYLAWNKLTFGTPSPVSGQIKQWWGEFSINVYGGPAKAFLSFIGMQYDFNAWQPATAFFEAAGDRMQLFRLDWLFNVKWDDRVLFYSLVLLLVCFLAAHIKKNRTSRAIVQAGLIPLFAGSWLQILFYNSTGYAGQKDWYWLTEQVLIVGGFGYLADLAFSLLLKKWRPTRILMWGLALLFGVWMAFAYGNTIWNAMPYGYYAPDRPYLPMLPFLEKHTPAGSIIGMTGGGNIGYFIHDRTIVNMDGLINSYAYFQALKGGIGADYLYREGVRYIFANPFILKAPPYRGQYDDRLYPLYEYGGKDLMQLSP